MTTVIPNNRPRRFKISRSQNISDEAINILISVSKNIHNASSKLLGCEGKDDLLRHLSAAESIPTITYEYKNSRKTRHALEGVLPTMKMALVHSTDILNFADQLHGDPTLHNDKRFMKEAKHRIMQYSCCVESLGRSKR